MYLTSHHCRFLIVGFLFVCGFMPVFAVAAPFCMAIQNGVSPQCIYYDVNQCYSDSAKMGGRCVANTDLISSSMSARFVGSGEYCFMDSYYFVSCIFQTQDQCRKQISSGSVGVCVRKGAVDGTLEVTAQDSFPGATAQEVSVLQGIDALEDASAASPNASSFDPLKPFDLNITNKGSRINFND